MAISRMVAEETIWMLWEMGSLKEQKAVVEVYQLTINRDRSQKEEAQLEGSFSCLLGYVRAEEKR